jgi:hypothetical protein
MPRRSKNIHSAAQRTASRGPRATVWTPQRERKFKDKWMALFCDRATGPHLAVEPPALIPARVRASRWPETSRNGHISPTHRSVREIWQRLVVSGRANPGPTSPCEQLSWPTYSGFLASEPSFSAPAPPGFSLGESAGDVCRRPFRPFAFHESSVCPHVP